MIRLKQHKICPPGEFFITLLIRNGRGEPIHAPCPAKEGCRKFGPSPDIKQVAKEMVDFLKGNNLPGAVFADCLEMVDVYTCQRLGNNKRFCRDSDSNYAETTQAIVARAGRGCCGAKL